MAKRPGKTTSRSRLRNEFAVPVGMGTAPRRGAPFGAPLFLLAAERNAAYQPITLGRFGEGRDAAFDAGRPGGMDPVTSFQGAATRKP